MLLENLKINLNDLYYQSQVIPKLKKGGYISISHAIDYVAIALSEHDQVGIDIEQHQIRIISLSEKFLNPKDSKVINSDASIVHLTRIWSAKEAMYKAFGQTDVSFKNQMAVHFNFPQDIGKGSILYRKESFFFDLYFREFNQHTLCVCAKVYR